MRSIIYLLGALSAFSTSVAAYESDPACTSNVYLVDKREYKAATWARFEEIPEVVPAVMAQIFDEIGTVPVDASDAYVASFFTAPPKIVKEDDQTTVFVWQQQAGDNEVHLNLSKEAGCIKKIVLSYRRQSKQGKNIESLMQDNIVPERSLVFFGKDENRICTLNHIQHQRITHSIYNKPRYIREDDLPPFVAFTLRGFLKTGLHGSQRTLYDLGKPTRVKGNLVWSVKDGHGKPYTIEVDLQQSCDKTMSIRWKDTYGRKHMLERENTFVVPES